MKIEEIVDRFPANVPAAAIDTVIKGRAVLDRYLHPVCFLMACRPADDDMVDLLTKLDPDKRIRYYVVCTMDEYNVLAEHIKYLERKYEVEIDVAAVTHTYETTMHMFADSLKADLVITSDVAEGSEHETCVTIDHNWIDSYRPLFWFTASNLAMYDSAMNIVHAEVRT